MLDITKITKIMAAIINTKTLIIVSVVFLSACRDTPDYYTSQGLGVFEDNALFSYEIEGILEDTIEQMPYAASEIRANFAEQKSEVRFYLEKPDGEHNAYTYTRHLTGTSSMRVNNGPDMIRTCVSNSPFLHELIHVIQFERDGTEDYSHADKTIWRTYDMSEIDESSAERRASVAVCQRFCGCP